MLSFKFEFLNPKQAQNFKFQNPKLSDLGFRVSSNLLGLGLRAWELRAGGGL